MFLIRERLSFLFVCAGGVLAMITAILILLFCAVISPIAIIGIGCLVLADKLSYGQAFPYIDQNGRLHPSGGSAPWRPWDRTQRKDRSNG